MCIQDGRYHLTVLIDGVVKHTFINLTPKTFKNMKMYVGSRFSNAANVKVKNLVFKNLGK